MGIKMTAACGAVWIALNATALCTSATADDWAGWRGPNRDGISHEKNLLQNWPENGPAKVWTNTNAGFGYAGISVVGDQLFTLGLDEGKEFALCLNANTGDELWRTAIGDQFTNNWGDGPRSTPTVDGDFVYVLTALGDLACLKKQDGKLVWSKNLTELGGQVPQWGYSESPLIDGNRVVVTPGGEQGSLAAFDKSNGKLLWQSNDVKTFAHYSSVIAVDWNNRRQYIQSLVDGQVGIDAETGKLLWQSEWGGRIAVIPTPIFSAGRVYATAGYNVGCKMIALDGDNQATEKYANKVMKNHHGGAILVGDHVYGFSDDVGFVCQELDSGELVWNDKRNVKKGAVAYADGLFYFVQEGDGLVMLLEANPEGLTVKSKFTLDPQTENRKPAGRIWVHPVIANGKLYLRDQEIIICYDIRAKGAAGE